MLSKKSDRECKHRQGAVGFAAKARWAARIVAALLICTYAPLGLHAEDPCDAAILAPPLPPKPAQSCPPTAPPGSISDGTKFALACAWIDPNRTKQVLKALELLTSGPQAFDLNRKVLERLTKGSSPADNDLYRAALGDLDDSVQSAVQGSPDFLDTVAKANRRGTVDDSEKVKYQIKLFACTQNVINDLFATGKSAIVRINDSFVRKNNYVALYQLLDAVWKQQGLADDKLHLEKLRAAFDTNADLLAKQVAAKVTAAKN
ncbi:MAG: hypothetical protein WCA13_00035 [Terriglobales bacterium]